MRQTPAALICATGLALLTATAPAAGQARFLERCGLYAGSRTTLAARPHAKALCRCYADRIKAARDIPAVDKKRLLAVRPGRNHRISVATIRAMDRINRVCWQNLRKKRTR